MSKLNPRKPLALAAVFASSVASVAAGGAANATTYGAAASPVTVTTGNTVNVVGGSTVTLPAGAHDVSWAGQGGRIAFIGGDNGVYTADFDGSHVIQIATPASAHGTRSHTVWDAWNHYVLWAENGGTIWRALANGNYVNWGMNPVTIFQGDVNNVPGSGEQISWPDVAADFNETTVFQTTGATGNGVGTESWANGTQKFTQVVPDATTPGNAVDTQPTISPDGKSIVFVKKDAAGDKQLYLVTQGASGWGTPVQVTFDKKVDHTAPIFEVDGKTVAYTSTDNTSPAPAKPMTGTYSVDVTKAVAPVGSTPGSNPSAAKISDLVGGIAVRTDSKALVQRFAGATRFNTAVLASQHQWADSTPAATDHRMTAQTVTLSRSDLFADALGGAGLASHNDGPLLLTSTSGLTAETEAEILRILPKSHKVFLLGGTTAISPAVEARLQQLGYTTERVAGATRYDTAVAIANKVAPNPTQILLATGTNFPDALSAGAVSAVHPNTVVLLTDDKVMPSATFAYLNSHQIFNGPGTGGAYLDAIGGQAAAALTAPANWNQADFRYGKVVGKTRYETSALVAQDFFNVQNGIGVAIGTNWPDALSGGAFMGQVGGPLLLIDPAVGLTDATDPDVGLTQGENALIDANRGSNNYAYVFGGTAVLPAGVDLQLGLDVQTATGVITR